MNKIVRYFPDSDLRGQHKALALQASKGKVNVDSLGAGEFLVFVNRKRDKLKMYTGGNVVAYLKMKDGHKLNPSVIRNLPKHFSGAGINYDAAMKETMQQQFPQWFEKKSAVKNG